MKSFLAISAWGNSQGIRLSRALLNSVGFSSGMEVEAVVIGPGRLELRAKQPRPTLAQKLKRYDSTLHSGELMADAPVGVEFGGRKT